MPHAEWSTVAVLLRNGKPDRLLQPGRRFARAWGAPILGRLQLVQVNTGVEPTNVTIRNIRTKDVREWAISSLKLRLSVQINAANDYSALEQHVRSYGPGFANALLDELSNGIDQYVRSTLARYSHRELHTSSLPDILFPTGEPTPIGNSSLAVRSATVVAVEWSPYFLEELKGIETATTEKVVTERKIDLYEELSSRVGIPAWHLANPEVMKLERAAAMELVGKLLEPANRSLLQRDPTLLPALLMQAGLTTPPVAGDGGAPGRTGRSGATAARQLDARPSAPALPVAPGDDTPDLSLNARLSPDPPVV
ncbi:hypothetical protein, partial [Actinotalea ferrariae]|uniref:hypothetical protein n=1 Tax=Actinotalea ferrariae TaxID=1386098 RepID=UPI0012DC0C47